MESGICLRHVTREPGACPVCAMEARIAALEAQLEAARQRASFAGANVALDKIESLEAQLREREAECERLRPKCNECQGWMDAVARAESAETALAAARAENERARDKVCPHLKKDEQGVESCWARDTVNAYRDRARPDDGRVDRRER